MLRDELRLHPWYWWLLRALAFVFVLFAGCVGTVVVFGATL